MIRGYLYDVYALPDKIVLWIKGKRLHRIEKKWTSSIYVAADNQYLLNQIQKNTSVNELVKRYEWVKRFEKVSDIEKTKVLKIYLKNSKNTLNLAKRIQSFSEFGIHRLYNVDIPPEQLYLYENDLFVLGEYEIENSWKEISNIKDTDYTLPSFTKINLKVTADSQKIPSFDDKIKSIQINDVLLESNFEEDIIVDCVRTIKKIDPDFIITERGDSWDVPFLAHRASKNKILHKTILGRENIPLAISHTSGTSYHSYGQVHFKPTASILAGRVHIDKSNCFIWNSGSSIEGLYEIARTCRLPLQSAARASIGKCMSSVQFYNAEQRKLLVPWKPTVSEIFKTRMDLLVGDRGGLILEPKIGVYENVGEMDFASLFGNIMLKKNISAETINCECCPDSKNRVPDTGYHICKREGIVPQSLKLLLDKREGYTKLIESTKDRKKLETSKKRKAALKWILVTSFGYLGFNNAKFGRIDAHMSVCAFARKTLLKAIKIAEIEDFEILHGIVDSMWIYKKNATKNDYEQIKDKIRKKTGFEISLDVYKWIAFLASKNEKKVPVPNRYFGANKKGELKIRGIATRRHDTPRLLYQCQMDILNLFAKCNSISEIRQSISEARDIQNHYESLIIKHKVSLKELVITNRMTRGTDQHKSKTIQSDALNQLKWHGRSIMPGQKIRYIIGDYARKAGRVTPVEIIEGEKYDAKKYSELLNDACESIISPFLS